MYDSNNSYYSRFNIARHGTSYTRDRDVGSCVGRMSMSAIHQNVLRVLSPSDRF